jgi:hypothetical protein
MSQVKEVRKVLALMVAGLLLGSTVGCSKRKSEDNGSTAKVEGDTGTPGPSAARQTLEAVRQAYVDQDMETVLSHVDSRYYPDTSRLRRALYEDREVMSNVRLEFHVDQEITGDDFTLITVRWNRAFTPMATGTPVTPVTGRAEFQFSRSDGRLIDIRPVNGGMPIGFN